MRRDTHSASNRRQLTFRQFLVEVVCRTNLAFELNDLHRPDRRRQFPVPMPSERFEHSDKQYELYGDEKENDGVI